MHGRDLLVPLLLAAGACGTPTPLPERFEEVGPASAVGGGGSAGQGGAGGGAAGGAAGAGGSTTSAGGGGAGTGGTASCDDGPGEPNEALEKAFELDPIDACDDQSKIVIGTLGDDADVDWYRFEGSAAAGCVADPTCGLSADDSLRLCMFFDCKGGGTTVECPAGSTSDTVSMLPGCCSAAPFAPNLGCGGANDAATVYIRVDQPGRACEPYLITYHY